MASSSPVGTINVFEYGPKYELQGCCWVASVVVRRRGKVIHVHYVLPNLLGAALGRMLPVKVAYQGTRNVLVKSLSSDWSAVLHTGGLGYAMLQ